MRIGEILALRRNRVDFQRGRLEISQITPTAGLGVQTRSSRRVIPMSVALSRVLVLHRALCLHTAPDYLVFCTTQGTTSGPKTYTTVPWHRPVTSSNYRESRGIRFATRAQLSQESWISAVVSRHGQIIVLWRSLEDGKTPEDLLHRTRLQCPTSCRR
jgi:integrase